MNPVPDNLVDFFTMEGIVIHFFVDIVIVV